MTRLASRSTHQGLQNLSGGQRFLLRNIYQTHAAAKCRARDINKMMVVGKKQNLRFSA